MALTRGLQWTGTCVAHGHRRICQAPRGIRSYSAAVHSKPLRTPTFRISYPRTSHISIQSRSLSLFGWGSPSKPQSTDVPVSETSVPFSSNPTIAHDTTSSSRIVKASHGTAESHDVSQLQTHAPTPLEPESLEKLQQAVTIPHGAEGISASAVDLANEPERIGYLREVCGLDFGWGPTSTMEWVLEHLHMSAGLSWATAIVTLAVAIRTALIPALIMSGKQQSKMREAQPLLAPLRQQYKDALLVKDQMKAQQISMQIKSISKEFDISIWKAFVPLLIQLPFGYGAWRLLRSAGSLPVPGFVTETWLWTSDLSFSDPYLITPALSSAFIYLTFKSNMAAQNSSMNMNFMKLMSNIFPVGSFVFMLFQPGAVQLYFMTSTFVGLITAQLMRNPIWRRYFKLGPLPGSVPAVATTTAAESSTAATGSASTNTIRPTPGAGGLNRRSTFYVAPKPAAPEPSPATDRSAIDRGVDRFKTGWADIKKSASGLSSDVLGSMEKRQAADRAAKLDRYEEQQRMREDELRQARNEQTSFTPSRNQRGRK